MKNIEKLNGNYPRQNYPNPWRSPYSKIPSLRGLWLKNANTHRKVASPSFVVVIFSLTSPMAKLVGLDRMGEERGG